jgi:hypothetical protein
MPRKRRTPPFADPAVSPVPEAVEYVAEVVNPSSPARFPCSVAAVDSLFRLIGADDKPMVDDAGRVRDGGGYEDEVKAHRRCDAINGEPAKRERANRNAPAAA